MSPAALTQGNFQPTYPEKVPEGLAAGCKATSGSQEVFHASSTERWAAFNFISAASNKAIVIAIDQHPMWVYAVDGVFVEPQQVDTLFVYNGERYSVLVALDQTPGDYTIRIANNLPDQLVSGYGTLSYVNGNKKTNSTPTINYGGVATLPGARALQTAVLSPLAAPPVAQAADATYVLEMGRYQANWRWTMTNESSYLPETNNSGTPLLQLTDPAAYAKAHSDHIIATRNGSWVDLVVVSGIGPSNPAQPPHPIHKHGNKGYVIGGGNGMFNWSSVAEAQKAQPEAFNLVNPPYRDGFVTPPVLFAPAWVAFRYYVDNPGAWLLHCHIQTHLVGGMALAVLDGVDQWPAGASGASGYVTKGNA
jgi:FtsP/CotA-like multicopper oxidase with cupredoxin domain